MASLLRDDAGQAGDLLFSMIYNPWRAIVQLIGTLAILAIVDYRMLLGGLALVPAVWVSHKTWIGRIRPLYRDTKMVRQEIDATTTEAFGGMRVGARLRAAARRERAVWQLAALHGAAGDAGVVVEPHRGDRVGGADPARVRGRAGVRRVAGDQGIAHHRRRHDVLHVPADAAGAAGDADATAANIQSNLAAFDRVLDLLDEEKEFAGTLVAARNWCV